jgi:hypothetical protein
MRRALLICLFVLFLCPPAGAAAAARVKLLACVPALAAQERSATFEARVRKARGSVRMQVRFTLQVRDATLPGWRRVVAGGLDEWLTSEPYVRRYIYAKTVRNLSAPAAYRTIVRFRWLDPDGVVLRRSRRPSPPCRQPDMRPNLTAARIEVAAPLAKAPAQYLVTVRNGAGSASGPFAVTLAAGELVLAPITLPGLAPGERRTLTFTGPACAAGASLTAAVDPALAVDERDERDNVLIATCPLP